MKKILLFTIAMLFALVAKATQAQPTLINGEWGFIIDVEQGDDLNGKPGPENEVTFITDFSGITDWTPGIYKEKNSDKLILRYYQGSAPGNIYVSDISKLIIKTDGVSLKGGDLDAIAGDKYAGLTYLDLENATIENVNKAQDNPITKLANKQNLKTLVFPNTDGLFIPSQSFQNSHLETVIFPDNKGSYSMGASAFGQYSSPGNTYLKKVQLGKGFTIVDSNNNPLTITQSNHTYTGVTVNVFAYCTNLDVLVLDKTITQLGSSMFEGCTKLDYVVLPEDLIHMGAFCFKSTGLKTITIPDHIQLFDGAQICQYCKYLTDIYVDGEYVKMGYQALLEENQTNNFRYNGGTTYSALDYTPTNSEFSDYHVPVLHYPGTEISRNNYRRPAYFKYNRLDTNTGTTWPDNEDWSDIQDPVDGFDREAAMGSDYGGWWQLYLGAQTIKEQDVFVDRRIKHSLWYSIVFPVDLTDAQFHAAYGLRADLNEFSGAVYDEENNKITLEFKEAAKVDEETKILVKRNVPYMIHPGDINLVTKKIIERYTDEGDPTIKAKYKIKGYDENEQPIYETEQVVQFYNVKSDLFLKWDDQDNTTMQETVMKEAETKLYNLRKARALVKRTINGDGTYSDEDIADAPARYTFIGSYREGKKIPAGSYYWGGRSAEEAAEQGITGENAVVPFKFYYSKSGTQKWVPYGALIMTSATGQEIDNPFTTTVNTDNGQNAKSLDADMSLIYVEEPNTTTGLDKPAIEIPVVKTNSKVYNMNGQVVRNDARDLNSLGKGLYIVNGRKIVIK